MMMFSYGSGLSATMFSLRLSEGKAPFSLSNIAKVMNVDEKLKRRTEVCLFYLLIIHQSWSRYFMIIVHLYLFLGAAFTRKFCRNHEGDGTQIRRQGLCDQQRH